MGLYKAIKRYFKLFSLRSARLLTYLVYCIRFVFKPFKTFLNSLFKSTQKVTFLFIG